MISQFHRLTIATVKSVFGVSSLLLLTTFSTSALAQVSTPSTNNTTSDRPFTSTAPNASSSVDVPFTGVVEIACTFDTPDPGRLVPVGTPIAEVLSSLESGGLPGQVNLKCNGETQLVVNEPTQTGGPSVELSLAEAFVDSPVGNTSASGSPLPIPPGLEIPLQVDMRVTARDLRLGFPPGTYTYKVTLTVAP